MIFYVFLLCIIKCCHSLQMVEGWEYLNLHCRDNSDETVDWWYVYKPPSNVGPTIESGINFSYITPEFVGRWSPSPSHFFNNSLLRHTLAPLFTPEYAEFMGLVVFGAKEASEDFKGSASLGIMMANEMGGVFIGHTVPGFPDMTQDVPTFPPEEINNGHMIMCLTLDLPTLNSLAVAIKQTEPHIEKIFIPEKLRNHLSNWVNLNKPEPFEERISKTSVKKTKTMHFLTMDKSLRGIMLARSPGDSRCLYKSFAKAKGIVMDVYGHMEHNNAICEKKYSLRNINSISLKYSGHIYYIDNQTDSMGFAVSTAGLWQRNGQNKNQHWVCTGNIENQPLRAKGGMIVCVSHFHVWLSFDNFKVKEPDCN